MRSLTSQKRTEDPVAIILTSYMQEVRLAAFELVHADLKDVRLVRTGKANPKADANRNRFATNYVKEEEFARITTGYLKSVERELLAGRGASKEYDWHGKGWEWVPNPPAVDSSVAGFAAGLSDYRINSQIDIHIDSKNTRDLKTLRQKRIDEASENLKASSGLQAPAHYLSQAFMEAEGVYKEVGMTADCQSLVYLTADFSGKNLKSLAPIASLSPQIRSLNLRNNK